MIYTYSPFGYEGALVAVEVDLRRGIPAVDIVGLADIAVKETRERVRYAFSNSGIEFPSERVLIALSPADLRKDSPMDLAMAVAILNTQNDYHSDVLVLGELELSGKVRPVRGVHAAISNAKANGISKFVIPTYNKGEAEAFDGIQVIYADSLSQVDIELRNNNWTDVNTTQQSDENFNTFLDDELKSFKVQSSVLRALEIAVAGRHHVLFYGAPGCGKTMAIQYLVPAITPTLTLKEANPTTRIWSLAGLTKPTESYIRTVPFRMPHQTATVEGICGGGPNCRPGEISLAHNGVLFLDEAAEFRSSVLQLLRVPMESKRITLSRAGRSTTYPANFQLYMATNPCPCGNFGNSKKICLCSARSVEQYWKKFGDPLLDRVSIAMEVDADEEKVEVNLELLRNRITNARKLMDKYNEDIYPEDILNLKIKDSSLLEGLTPRRVSETIKVAKTIANLDGRTDITKEDIAEAKSLFRLPFDI